jgi:hypothetical protein
VRADRLSRLRFDPRDWALAGYVFKFLQRQLQVYCSFDLFADRANTQCKRYCSAHSDGEAEFVNAWTRPWGTLHATLFAHPPYILIPRVVGTAGGSHTGDKPVKDPRCTPSRRVASLPPMPSLLPT